MPAASMGDAMLPPHVSITTTPDLRSISQQPPAMDPDISATLSDFLTYTEHLPSAVIRSMTLIETLNRNAVGLQKRIHEALVTYTDLPSMATTTTTTTTTTTSSSSSSSTNNVPDPWQLRAEVSVLYDKLEECKRMSAAEAVRIEDMVTRDARRLDIVVKKLHTLPMPPSRDATPDLTAADATAITTTTATTTTATAAGSSPQLKRSLHAQQSADKRAAAHRTTTAPRVRNKDKIMVPGEVLPPPNPDSPPPSEPDDWPSPSPRPASPHDQRPRQKSTARQLTPRPPKPHKEKLQKTPRVRPPGMPGTNAHSAVAGISTSNAIMALTKPPPNAVPGSKWLPWKRLTEYELAILRKRMKKNAAWKPSPAMRNRELKNLGRGQQAMDQAKADAEAATATAVPFVDDYDSTTWIDPTKTSVSGEQQAEMNAILGPEKEHTEGDDALINRGMRLNEAKKLKREKQKAEEAALLQSQLHQLHTPALSLPVSQPRQRPEKLSDPHVKRSSAKPSATANTPAPSRPFKSQTPADTASKKRKRDPTPPPLSIPTANLADSPALLASQRSAPERKKLKLSLSAAPSSSETTATRSASNPSLPPKSATPAAPSPRMSIRPKSRRTSAAPEPPPSTSVTPSTRSNRTGTTITIKRPKAASAEPPPNPRSRRRASNASLPGAAAANKKTQSPTPKTGTPDQTGDRPRRVHRRPVPGVVAAEDDGSAKVSIGKRKNPPSKKQAQHQNTNTNNTPQHAQQGRNGNRKDDSALATMSAAEEEVDPDETRYCVCGDVSWGTMICCDNSNCEKEWFHLECVGLEDMPPRRAKWYCPDCRRKLKLGQATNGIVPPR